MRTFSIIVNGEKYDVECDENTPLLWVLRDELKLTGTKYGCGIGHCGACTVHVANGPVRSCGLPISLVGDNEIVTIEGLNEMQNKVILAAYEKHNVPQCGYCQSGQIMSAIALLRNNKEPSENDIDKAMSGNICRCGTYYRIKKAILELSHSEFN